MSASGVIVRQFGKPSGPLGALAGLVMRLRPSNRERSLRTVALLELRPGDDVLEVGFGPGLAVERAAELASRGTVAGVDHSGLMLRQARRRNRRAIQAGRVDLRLGAAEHLPDFGVRFDKVLAVNVSMFWSDPAATLRGLRQAMKPGGTIALTLQPRRRGGHPPTRGPRRSAWRPPWPRPGSRASGWRSSTWPRCPPPAPSAAPRGRARRPHPVRAWPRASGARRALARPRGDPQRADG